MRGRVWKGTYTSSQPASLVQSEQSVPVHGNAAFPENLVPGNVKPGVILVYVEG